MQAQLTHSTRHFVLHYVEMVAAMFIGMFALYAPAGVLLSALGTSCWQPGRPCASAPSMPPIS